MALGWAMGALERVRGQVEARRVHHGRGKIHGGPIDLALEWYPPLLLVLAYSEQAKEEFLQVKDLFMEDPSIEAILVQNRRGDGPPTWERLKGEVHDDHVVSEDGLKYRVHFQGRQNPGLFLASREARQWVRGNSGGLKVLNLFAFTGAFGVCAMKGEARELVQVDMKRNPLMQGKTNLELNGIPASGVEFWAHDILRSKGKIRKRGPWDLIILDPPTFQKGAWKLDRDLPKIIRSLDDWTDPKARVLICIHDPFTPLGKILLWMEEEKGLWEFQGKLDQVQGFEEEDPEEGLKVLIFQKR